MCLPCTIQSTRKLLVHVWLWLKIYHPFFISLFVCLFAHLFVYMSSVQLINLQSQSNVYEGLKSIPDRKLVCPPFSLALFISSPSGWFGVRGWTIGIELTIPRANFLSPNPLFSTLLSPPSASLPFSHLVGQIIVGWNWRHSRGVGGIPALTSCRQKHNLDATLKPLAMTKKVHYRLLQLVIIILTVFWGIIFLRKACLPFFINRHIKWSV